MDVIPVCLEITNQNKAKKNLTYFFSAKKMPIIPHYFPIALKKMFPSKQQEFYSAQAAGIYNINHVKQKIAII